ncbi:MAG: type II secretion system F family protein [Phycisphaerales bacterium]
MSIKTFRYKAIDSAGKPAKGVVRAADEPEAYRKVSASGLTPVSLNPAADSALSFSFQTIGAGDIADFTRELCVLIEARIPLDRGLLSIAEHEGKPALTEMVRDIAAKVQAGAPMTVALRDYREHFGDVYIETMRAAEKSGNLSAVMNHLAEMLEKQIESNQALRRAMTYPVILLGVVSAALSVIVVFVVPKFAAIFKDQEVALPLSTRVIQAVGHSAHEYWWAYVAGIVAALCSLTAAWKSPEGRRTLEDLLLRVPYVGKIIVSVTAARFARVVGIGLASGLDVIESIDIGGRSTGRPNFVAECSSMASRLRGGQSLSEVMADSRYVPQFARRMLAAGKDATELSNACGVVSRYYDRESNHLMKNINTVIEPMMTIAMAVIVLIVALSVFLPMWEMVKLNH